MTRTLIALTLGSAAVASPLAQGRPVERQSSRILIDVSVLDGRGSPVTDLRRDEIEVWVSGYRVPVESFVAVTPETREQPGRSIVLLLDDITLPLQLVPRAREIAQRVVNRMTPGDEVAIVSLQGSVGVEASGDRASLLAAISRFNIRTIGVTPFDALGERVLETVGSIARQRLTERARRKTIVGIGSAWLLDTPIPPPTAGRDLKPEWTAAMRAMAFANTVFHVIDPAGVGTRAFGGDAGFARETGGRAFVNTNDFAGAVDRIMGEAANYYLVGIADPPVQRKAELRELELRTPRRGITLKARRAIPGS